MPIPSRSNSRDSTQTVTGVIEEESDRAGSLFDLSPRLMMHWQDVVDTALLGPGSRTRYTLMLDGPDDQLAAYMEGRELKTGQRAETIKDGSQALSGNVDRAREYSSHQKQRQPLQQKQRRQLLFDQTESAQQCPRIQMATGKASGTDGNGHRGQNHRQQGRQ